MFKNTVHCKIFLMSSSCKILPYMKQIFVLTPAAKKKVMYFLTDKGMGFPFFI